MVRACKPNKLFPQNRLAFLHRPPTLPRRRYTNSDPGQRRSGAASTAERQLAAARSCAASARRHAQPERGTSLPPRASPPPPASTVTTEGESGLLHPNPLILLLHLVAEIYRSG
jgi:hypothetical protein